MGADFDEGLYDVPEPRLDPVPAPISGRNDISGQLWQLVEADPDNPVKSGYVFVGSFSWQSYADANHHVRVEDGRENVIFESFGNTDLAPVEIHFAKPVAILDLRLVAIDSGTFIVEIE